MKNAKDTCAQSDDARLTQSGHRAGDPPQLGRKAVLLGMFASGAVIANAALPSADTVKPPSIPADTARASSIPASPSGTVTKWAPGTAYPVGRQVINPNNDVVSALVSHTSAAAYSTDAAKWKLSKTFAGKPSAADLTFIVSPRGSDSNDGLTRPSAKATIASALSAAGGAACVIQLAAGSHTMPAGVALTSGSEIRGTGTYLTLINYTGSGAAFTSAQPGVRTHSWRMSDFTLQGPGHTSAAVGIDLDSVSSAHLQDMVVTGFGKGIRVRSVVGGGAVYNRLSNATVIDCGTGLSIEPSSSNATTLEGCRACACDIGVKILNSNDTVIKASQIESNTVGVHIEASSAALADYNAMDHCRFEGNTMDWETTVLVHDTIVSFPHQFGNYTFSDLGQRTVQLNGWVPMPTGTRNIIGAASFGVGGTVFDTTLGKPIWSNGTVWKDAAGATV